MADDVILDEEGFINIESIDFFGRYEMSRNGVYILAWADYSNENQNGKFVLLESKRIILQGTLQRPNDGKIADNGTFVFNDWLFGSGLKGTFIAYDILGRQIICQSFSANILNNGLSNDGRYAVCQMAHSDSPDSGVLVFFDLTKGQITWQKKPETGWADSYQFDVDNGIIKLVYGNFGKFRYNYAGDFLDKERWYKARIQYGTGFDLLKIAQEKQENLAGKPTEEAAKEIILLLQTAITRMSDYPYQLAKVHRKIGEIYENLGQTNNAIVNYEKAIGFYPKIGVKRKLTELKNHIG